MTAKEIYNNWFGKCETDITPYIERRLANEAGRVKLRNDIRTEKKLRTKDIDRRIELAQKSMDELLQETDKNDAKMIKELQWIEGLCKSK